MARETPAESSKNTEPEEDRIQRYIRQERSDVFVKVTVDLLNRGRHLTAPAKWLYVALRSFRNESTGLAFPSYKKIMERSGLSRNAVAKGLAELERWGWIRRHKSKDRSSTKYEFYYPALVNKLTNQEVERDQTFPTKELAKQWAVERRHKSSKQKK